MESRIVLTPQPPSPLEESLRQALEWGLVGVGDVVDGDLKVSSSSRRNLNLRLERRRQPSYLIKQPGPSSWGSEETVSTEARFYRFCASEPAAAAVASSMPPLAATFESDRVLVLELVEGASSLWQEYLRHGPPELPTEPARELGHLLGTLHVTFGEAASAAPRPPGLRRQPPGYFSFHEPHPQLLISASPARLELCRCLQEEPAAGAALAAAGADWRAETVIHGDVRSENLLIPAAQGRMLLVDWELVQLGDPAWDLAGAFEDHVRFWLQHMSPQSDLGTAERLATALWPLAAVQTAVRSLAAGYAAGSGRKLTEMESLLIRAVTLSAARLLQTAWENCRHLERLSTLSVLLVQVAVNILTDPERHANELYGMFRGEPW